MNNSVTFPAVSIIMGTYNRAHLIVETINSILGQTYTHWELIIVDDGSEDNTRELINQLNDDRIKFYEAGRIAISGKIKNIGLKKATGSLIAFIDSDDLWASSKLEKQVAALQQYPEAGFCLTNGYNFRKINEPSEYFYKQREGLKYGNIFIAFFKSEVAATIPTLILRKECLQITGTFKESKSFSDVEFILNLAVHFKAIILYEPLFYRRVHEENNSSSNWEERHYEGLEMIRSYKNSLPRKIMADSLFNSSMNFGEKCLRYKKRGTAIRSFFYAWKQKPFSIAPLKKTTKAVFYFLAGK